MRDFDIFSICVIHIIEIGLVNINKVASGGSRRHWKQLRDFRKHDKDI